MGDSSIRWTWAARTSGLWSCSAFARRRSSSSGIELHKNYAKGSDGRLGNDFVEIKTITPFKKKHSVEVRLDRHFSKLLVVKIDEDFEVSGRLMERNQLPGIRGSVLRIEWDQLNQSK